MDLPDEIYADIGAARGGRAVRDTYEDAAVRVACRALGLGGLPAVIAREVRARTDDASGGCSFALFGALTGFPVVLRVGRLRNVRFLSVPDLYNAFARTPIGLALALLADEFDPDDAPIGLVFRWAGAKDDLDRQRAIRKGGQYMVAHTAGGGAGPRIVAPMRLGDADRDVTVERLVDFLAQFAGFRPA